MMVTYGSSPCSTQFDRNCFISCRAREADQLKEELVKARMSETNAHNKLRELSRTLASANVSSIFTLLVKIGAVGVMFSLVCV